VLGHYVWQVKANGRTIEGDFAHVFTVAASDRGLPGVSWTQPRRQSVSLGLSTK